MQLVEKAAWEDGGTEWDLLRASSSAITKQAVES